MNARFCRDCKEPFDTAFETALGVVNEFEDCPNCGSTNTFDYTAEGDNYMRGDNE